MNKTNENDRNEIRQAFLSENHKRKMERFHLFGRIDCDRVCVLLALGDGRNPDWVFPEWIVYTDPNDFMSNTNGQVNVKLASIEKRDVDPQSPGFGAYFLGKPTDVPVHENLMYENKAELIRIVSGLLQKAGIDTVYREADIDVLYEQDLDMNIPAENSGIIFQNQKTIQIPVCYPVCQSDNNPGNDERRELKQGKQETR